MCGIFGFLSLENVNISKIIIDGLTQLQNRGYDSSGLCYINEEKLKIYKYATTSNMSSIQKLCSLELDAMSHIGMGHNRWATHGAKTDTNAHPHISNDKQFVVVHNGIIENFKQLKDFLSLHGFIFHSQTDTEIIVNLIQYHYQNQIQDGKSVFVAIEKTITMLQGTYGIIVMSLHEKRKLYCVRNGSPLLLGQNDDCVVITSEQSGFCNMMNNYIILQNDDICIVEVVEQRLHVKTDNDYVRKNVNNLNEQLTPDPYAHWTLKEIYEQPNAVLNAINKGGRIKNNCEVKLGGLERHLETLKEINNMIILGCGTSYFSGIYGSHYFKHLCNFNTVQVFDGAEFDIHDIPKYGKTALLLISQSGETKDLHRCIEIAKDSDLFTIGVVNVVDSLIAREVNCGIYCNAGKEVGVASTKSFTSQVVCLSMSAIWFAQIHGINQIKRTKMISDLHNLYKDVEKTIEIVKPNIFNISENLKGFGNMFLLGKGTDECIAKEGSLKIKEISYIHSEGYSASSLKHGPFALLEKDFPVILLNLSGNDIKMQNCLEEVKSRYAKTILISNAKHYDSDYFVCLPKNESYSSLLGIIPIQLLAYFISIKKGLNPDTPKNLAKVVTVE
jgi:glucosamine--fructose-6-phosphate aminotransferase (isomerizing)